MDGKTDIAFERPKAALYMFGDAAHVTDDERRAVDLALKTWDEIQDAKDAGIETNDRLEVAAVLVLADGAEPVRAANIGDEHAEVRALRAYLKRYPHEPRPQITMLALAGSHPGESPAKVDEPPLPGVIAPHELPEGMPVPCEKCQPLLVRVLKEVQPEHVRVPVLVFCETNQVLKSDIVSLESIPFPRSKGKRSEVAKLLK
jgi:hypothetical protein